MVHHQRHLVNGCEYELEIYDRISSPLTQGTSESSVLRNVLFKGQGTVPLLSPMTYFSQED